MFTCPHPANNRGDAAGRRVVIGTTWPRRRRKPSSFASDTCDTVQYSAAIIPVDSADASATADPRQGHRRCRPSPSRTSSGVRRHPAFLPPRSPLPQPAPGSVTRAFDRELEKETGLHLREGHARWRCSPDRLQPGSLRSTPGLLVLLASAARGIIVNKKGASSPTTLLWFS